MTFAPAKRPPLWLLVIITISGTMAMHMFVPALPYATADLRAPVGQMQMTVSFYIIGLAVGQLFYGPMSDSLGRRPMLIAGLALYTAGGLAAALAPGVYTLVGARLVQAFGGCAGLALGRAIVRDSTHSEDMVRQLALMNLMIMVSPGLSPMVGGVVSTALGWRAIFWLTAALGAATLVITWKLLPETAPPGRSLSIGTLASDYRALLRSRRFVGLALGGGCATTAVYAFIAAAPFIFVTDLHRPVHEVGLYLGLLIFGMSFGNAFTGRMVGKIGIERLMLAGNVLSIVSAAGLLATVLLGRLDVAGTLVWMFLFTLGTGITSPAALTKAISVNPQLTGSAAGLYGFAQMATGAVCTSLVALGDDPARSATTVLLAAALTAFVAFRVALGGKSELVST
ncbi:Sulfonamide resistance protein (plasmid) [Variovorax sp. SRS16]|uniref:multidrug effflux MFS transporter n=1 Tax=Variovorax sp. SRS16 TaxID=282217 RepID=UPI001318C0FC|nr:multidrug effflux MFS transporter [Variovorax sp. SRS16]VTU46709.1 Sulfonamide resistance protein [Variovorax sp. SRS16]